MVAGHRNDAVNPPVIIDCDAVPLFRSARRRVARAIRRQRGGAAGPAGCAARKKTCRAPMTDGLTPVACEVGPQYALL